MGFDFQGRYTRIVECEWIEYILEDDRIVTVEFKPASGGVTVRETFDAESEFAAEQQRQGWQAILNRFAAHVAATHGNTSRDGGSLSPRS